MRIAIALIAASWFAFAADWYVDPDVAVSGDGQSWSTAWQDFGDIVWAEVDPGDTIYLSGGNYYDPLSPGKSGTDGAPITIKKSQAAGHSDIATLYGYYSSGANWITLDGALDDTYAASNVRFTYEVYNITNNIGWRIYSGVVTTNHAINIGSGGGPNGFVAKWLEISPGIYKNSAGQNVQGIRWQSGNVQNTVVEYCWIHHTEADGINNGSNSDPATDSMVIRYNLIEYIGDDGIQASGGVTAYCNIIGPALPRPGSSPPAPLSGHPDAFQITPGHNVRLYNNVLFDWNSYMTAVTIRSTNYLNGNTNVMIYGNVMYHTDAASWSMEAGCSMGVDGQFPWESGAEGEEVYITNAVYRDVYIFNNTIIANPEYGAGILDPYNMFNRYSPYYEPDKPALTVTLTNWFFANNICYNGKSFAANFKGWPDSGWQYDESEFVVQNNLFSGPTANSKRIGYILGLANTATYYTDAEAFDAATANSGNSSALPAFESYASRDFRLLSSDTAARGNGLNLASLGLPGIEYDVWGTYRGAGDWDIGAIAYAGESVPDDPSLLLWLRFEDNFPSNGFAADSSGYGQNMLRFGWVGDPTTNFPTITTGKVGSQAAAFVPYYNSYPYADPSFNDGQYGAITNLDSGMLTLVRGTFAAWVKFGYVAADDRTKNHNATILNAGYGDQGSWHWGRYYSSTYGEPQFNIQTNGPGGGASSTVRIKWPQVAPEYWYTNNVWRHLAATVSCVDPLNVVVRLYLDGDLVTDETVTLAPANAIPWLTVHNPANVNSDEWIAVGCWTHNGTPQFVHDGFPNNGWLNGSLDDVRIYNRILTQSEIRTLAAVPSTAGIGTAIATEARVGEVAAP